MWGNDDVCVQVLSLAACLINVLHAVEVRVDNPVVFQLPMNNVTFPCTFICDMKAKHSIMWEKGEKDKGRLLIEKTSNGKVTSFPADRYGLNGCSLMLKQPSLEDSGLYSVTVETFLESSKPASAGVNATFFESPKVLSLHVISLAAVTNVTVKSQASHVILPCNYTLENREDDVTIRWRHGKKNGLQVLHYNKGNISFGSLYKGKVEMGDGCSLVISNPQTKDSGIYSVSISSSQCRERKTDVHLEIDMEAGNINIALVILPAVAVLCVGAFLVVALMIKRRRKAAFIQTGPHRDDVPEPPSPADSLTLDSDSASKTSALQIESSRELRKQEYRFNLHAAVRNADLGMCLDVLQRGCDVNEMDVEGETALHLATSRGDQSIINLLLEWRTKADTLKHTETPLRFAAEKDHRDVMDRLCKAGARIDLILATGQSELHMATALRDTDAFHYLVNTGSDINQGGRLGNTPLHLAAMRGDEQFTELLIKSGADKDQVNKAGHSALHMALLKGVIQVVDIITEELFHSLPSVECNPVEVCRKLIDANFNIDLQDEVSNTALHFACMGGYSDVCNLLLTSNARTDLENKDGDTALHCATREGHAKIVDLLLAKGVDIDQTTPDGNTALHLAVNQGHTQTAGVLLRAGIQPNILNAAGESPLSLAVKLQKKDLIQLLEESGHTT